MDKGCGFRTAVEMGRTYDWDDLSLNQSREWDKVEVEREVDLCRC